jgi:hypothetical protein
MGRQGRHCRRIELHLPGAGSPGERQPRLTATMTLTAAVGPPRARNGSRIRRLDGVAEPTATRHSLGPVSPFLVSAPVAHRDHPAGDAGLTRSMPPPRESASRADA